MIKQILNFVILCLLPFSLLASDYNAGITSNISISIGVGTTNESSEVGGIRILNYFAGKSASELMAGRKSMISIMLSERGIRLEDVNFEENYNSLQSVHVPMIEINNNILL